MPRYSQDDFSKVSDPFAVFTILWQRVLSVRHPHMIVFSPWKARGMLPEDLRIDDMTQRIESLEGYMAEYPDFADAPRWAAEIETTKKEVARRAEKMDAIMEGQRAQVRGLLAARGYAQAVVEAYPSFGAMRSRAVVALSAEEADDLCRAVEASGAGNNVFASQIGYDLTAFSDAEKDAFLASTRHVFNELLCFLRAQNINNPQFDAALSYAQAPSGFLVRLVRKRSVDGVFDALNDFIGGGDTGALRERIPALTIRAILFAKAFWGEDAQAQKLVAVLDPVLAMFKHLSPGQEFNGDAPNVFHFITDIYETSPVVARSIQPHQIQLRLSRNDAQVENKPNRKRLRALEKDLQLFDGNPDFKDEVEKLNAETVTLLEAIRAEESEDDKKDALVSSCMAELKKAHDDGLIGFDPKTDVIRGKTNYSSSVEMFFNGTKADADALQKLPFFKDRWIRYAFNSWHLVNWLSGKDGFAEKYMPGQNEFAGVTPVSIKPRMA